MKTSTLFFAAAAACMLGVSACTSNAGEQQAETTSTTETTEEYSSGQSNVVDNDSEKDIVKVAAGSPDHTTLVAAVKAADLVNSLSNAGPFTVFAPVNAAFDALPKGTVDNLLKPENKDQLSDILQYHVALSTFTTEKLNDGMTLGQANGGNVKISHKDGKIFVNDAEIIGSVKASNGIVHVIDKVLLPAAN